jgi:hypothetical protein
VLSNQLTSIQHAAIGCSTLRLPLKRATHSLDRLAKVTKVKKEISRTNNIANGRAAMSCARSSGTLCRALTVPVATDVRGDHEREENTPAPMPLGLERAGVPTAQQPSDDVAGVCWQKARDQCRQNGAGYSGRPSGCSCRSSQNSRTASKSEIAMRTYRVIDTREAIWRPQ